MSDETNDYQAKDTFDPVVTDTVETFFKWLEQSMVSELFDCGWQLGVAWCHPITDKRMFARVKLTADRDEMERRVWDAIKAARRGGELARRPAYWTFDSDAWAYYFAPTERAKPPYRKQMEVKAIVDVADDGTLAGVELVWGQLPPPPPRLMNERRGKTHEVERGQAAEIGGVGAR